MITVPKVCEAIGIERDKHLMWAVGKIMQARYAEHFGHQPMKDNRPKTNGPGEHCFALYPPDWFDLIAAEIRKLDYIKSKQIDMFTKDEGGDDEGTD